ncbi:WEB family protein [Platanthera guangdongensis]|uniref:WEB family protein n=1 Tax=Platanthera guangdongensis TaxID=2320717 RepID=A0ABR2MME8_9ASPA
MPPSKPKSGFSGVVNNKNSPVSKIGRLGSVNLDADSPPQKSPSLSNDVSPRSADSKPPANRRSPKNITTPDKPSRPLKGSELQLQCTALQEDLVKTKEKLAVEVKEKTQVLEELSEAKKAVEEVSEKLAETLLALKNAEKNSELHKFRADELEQLTIEAARKEEKEWSGELEVIQKQHAVDVAALLSATDELQKANRQLGTAIDEKNAALNNAEDAMKIAEVNAEKVEILSGEVNRLQYLLDSKLGSESNEAAKQFGRSSSEVQVLKHELEKAKFTEEKLAEMEAFVKRLEMELMNTKKSESGAIALVDDWAKKAEFLESHLSEVKQSERSVRDSLESLTKQLDETNSMLDDTESEVISLRGKIEALDLEVARHKDDHEKSASQLIASEQEVLNLQTTLEILKSEILRVEDEKEQAMNNDKITSSKLEILAQERNNLAIELEITKEDSEKAKKAMEGLVSALHEVSAEARDIKERLLIKEAEVGSATSDAEELKLALENTQEKYDFMLDEAKNEMLSLKKIVEKSETEAENSRAEWNEKEISLSNALKKTDGEIASIMVERDETLEMLEREKYKVKAAEEEVNKINTALRRAESQLFAANYAMEEAKTESRRLKERLLDKENELQGLTQENDDLWVRNTVASEKIKELSELLAKLSSKKEDNVHTLNREVYNGYIQPKMEENESDGTETGNSEAPLEKLVQLEENGSKKNEEMNRVQMKPKICEGETIDDRSSETEYCADSIHDELDTLFDGNRLDQANVGSARSGSTSPTKNQELQKKKKALLHKFAAVCCSENTPPNRALSNLQYMLNDQGGPETCSSKKHKILARSDADDDQGRQRRELVKFMTSLMDFQRGLGMLVRERDPYLQVLYKPKPLSPYGDQSRRAPAIPFFGEDELQLFIIMFSILRPPDCL